VSASKVAFVTGAGSGIGKGTAEAFAQAGYAVAIVDRDEAAGAATEAALREAGHEAAFFACDVSDDASVAAAVAGTLDRFGRLDAAFNAAGIEGEHGKLTAEGTLENWNKVIAIDLTGTWLCLRHQIPAMLKSGGGSIVNCASVAGILGAPAFSAYVAAKHGVVGLTRTAAIEYVRHGVRVNAVCPGTIATPMNEKLDPELVKGLLAISPAGRMGLVAEVAQTVVFLCSEGAGFINGQAISVDGGWNAQ
jgi:NAD(P)-dependent dehydrogenase (short-subunit alcohol dehydrogenase family)